MMTNDPKTVGGQVSRRLCCSLWYLVFLLGSVTDVGDFSVHVFEASLSLKSSWVFPLTTSSIAEGH